MTSRASPSHRSRALGDFAAPSGEPAFAALLFHALLARNGSSAHLRGDHLREVVAHPAAESKKALNAKYGPSLSRSTLTKIQKDGEKIVAGIAKSGAAQALSDYKKLETRLRQARASEDRYGLKIRYQVDVYGKAPRIELFTKDDNLTSGPAPYGAPTHRDFMNQVTPIEYRPPVPDFGALLRWLSDRTKK